MKRIIPFLVLFSAIFSLPFCTDMKEENVPISLNVDVNELFFSKESASRSLIVESGLRWNIADLPGWVTLNSITQSLRSPYEWLVSFTVQINNGYDRSGIISFGTVNESVELSVMQEGKKGRFVAIESVGISSNELSLTEGESHTLIASIIPANASNQSLEWSSSNTAIATVDADGVVIAKKTGSAVITAMSIDGGKTATCSVTVHPGVFSATKLLVRGKTLIIQLSDHQSYTVSLLKTLEIFDDGRHPILQDGEWLIGDGQNGIPEGCSAEEYYDISVELVVDYDVSPDLRGLINVDLDTYQFVFNYPEWIEFQNTSKVVFSWIIHSSLGDYSCLSEVIIDGVNED